MYSTIFVAYDPRPPLLMNNDIEIRDNFKAARMIELSAPSHYCLTVCHFKLPAQTYKESE